MNVMYFAHKFCTFLNTFVRSFSFILFPSLASFQIKKHPNFATHVLFTSTGNRTEFVAGERVDLLVAVENTGKKPISLRGIQASIRMPQQWDFHIQNVCDCITIMVV